MPTGLMVICSWLMFWVDISTGEQVKVMYLKASILSHMSLEVQQQVYT